MFRSRLLSSLLLTTALLSAAQAYAASPAVDSNAPVLLNADRLSYDDKGQSVIAEGSVELHQNSQTVRADKMTYNRQTGVVVAEGDVRIWQPSGEVIFAKYAELSRDLRQAFVQEVSARLSDNSRFIATEGERTEGRYLRMDHALYTACEPCKYNRHKPPVWQVKADRIIHDNQTHDVVYRNATIEMNGIPVLYTPYLSHPDPTVKRRSGFLAPVVGQRTNLGFVTRTYYYLDVAPNMDATIETSYSTERGLLVGTEWRQKTVNNDLKISMSGTQDDIPNDAGGTSRSSALRGRFFLEGEHRFNANWRATADIQRTTDDTFLELWKYDTKDILPSRVAVERFTDNSYGAAVVRTYQDLRPGIDAAEPNVLTATYQEQGEQRDMLGGRWFLGTETRSVERSRGLDSGRASLQGGWRREDISPLGLVFTTEATVRADGFTANNLNGQDEEAFRPFVQTQFTARLPMVKETDKGQQYITPIAQLSLAPRQRRNPDDIANEDSIGLEFDSTNLFAPNRYAGYDRLDGGQRVAYGVQSGWTGNNGASVAGSFGQSYDFANNPNYADGTGLESQFSDFVGSLDFSLTNRADITYVTRIGHTDLRPYEHDLRATLGPDHLQGYINYLYLNQTTTDSSSASERQELGLGGRWKFTDEWSIYGMHRENLQKGGGPLSTALALTYQDECLTYSLNAERDYLSRSGLSSGDSVFFRIAFKNIGEFESPSFSPNLFGSRASNN